MLKLGKGSAFVKSRLLRFAQEEDEWEVDFHEVPCSTGGHATGYFGMVISSKNYIVREVTIESPPDVNDLADLVAHAMKSPFEGLPQRPKCIVLRNLPEWIELLPHLGQLEIDVKLKTELPKMEKLFKEALKDAQKVVHLRDHRVADREVRQGIPVLFTQAQRKAIADECPELLGHLHLAKASHTLHLNQAELQNIHDKALIGELRAKGGMKRNSFRHIIETTRMALAQVEAHGATPISELAFQFKITLRNSNPPIWRSVQVKNCMLDELHEAIQTAMGWTNSHLHHFRMPDGMYGDPDLVNEDEAELNYEDSTTTKLIDVLPSEGEPFVFEYEYDFGDSWYHDIEFEGRVPREKGMKYPRCIDGARAGPPEDSGGIPGYENLLAAISDWEHEDHEDMMRWVGKRFDPERFNAEAATKKMQKGLPDWRKKR